MECPYCEATMIDTTADIDRTEHITLVCLECGYTLEATCEGVETVLEPSANRLREKGEKLLKKAEMEG